MFYCYLLNLKICIIPPPATCFFFMIQICQFSLTFTSKTINQVKCLLVMEYFDSMALIVLFLYEFCRLYRTLNLDDNMCMVLHFLVLMCNDMLFVLLPACGHFPCPYAINGEGENRAFTVLNHDSCSQTSSTTSLLIQHTPTLCNSESYSQIGATTNLTHCAPC